MRQIITDALLALLASIGIWTLWRLIVEHIMFRGKNQLVFTVICLKHGAEGAIQTVHWLQHHPRGKGTLLVDCGMDDGIKNAVALSAEGNRKTWLCSQEQAGNWMKEAEIWTKQKNSIK